MTEIVVPSRNGKMNDRRSWQRHLLAPFSEAPKRLTAPAFDRLGSSERTAYNQRRLHHVHNFEPIVTPTLKVLTDALVDKVWSNYWDEAQGAKPAVALSGMSSLGKTWATKNALRTWELILRSDMGWPIGCRTEHGGEFLPVVHTTVSSRTTIKGWLKRLLAFYQATIPRYMRSDDDLLALALTYVEACGTEVIVIDDVHNIDHGAHSNAAQVNAFLKAFANDSGVTFVFVAVDIEKTGFMAEWRLRQLAGMVQQPRRSTVLNLFPFSIATDEDRREWLALLARIEMEVVLVKARVGMLTAHADMIHDRCQGVFGSLIQLIRTATQLAISTGEERLTEEMLDAADIDFAAEQQTRDSRKKGARATRRTILNKVRNQGSLPHQALNRTEP